MKGAFVCNLICTKLGELTCTSVRGKSAFGSIPLQGFSVGFFMPSVCDLFNNYVSQLVPMVSVFNF